MNDSHVMSLSDGRDLAWLEVGTSGGWPVLGFHGTPGSRLQWEIDVDAVRRANVRLIAPDRPGYGLSSFHPNRRLVDWPDDVRQLADHLELDRFSVIGVSGGGPHAAVCASKLPERVVAAGIVSGEGPLCDARVVAAASLSTKLLTRLFRSRSRLITTLFGVEIALARRWPSRALELMAKQLPPYDAEVLCRPEIRALFERDVSNSSRTAARAQAQDFELFASDWGFDLNAITVPVFLWHGEADKNVPLLHAEVLHNAIPNSVLTTFPGEGHLLVANRLEEILLRLEP